MKTTSLVLTPIIFIAGILTIVLLQRVGLVHIERPGTKLTTVVDAETNDVVQAVVSVSDTAATAGDSDNNDRLNVRIDELQQQLRSATVKADLMQVEIDQLSAEFQTAAAAGSDFLPNGGESPSQQNAQILQNRERQGQFFGNADDRDGQYESLVAAGVDPLVAEQIQQRNDQWTLQRLELVDQATREGWRRSEQFGDRLTTLREERPDIRTELGDENYDRYLYSSGEFNRVQVSSIINGSAADAAGMLNGDMVLSYANVRVFTMRELQRATSAGSRGESVQLNVLRDGAGLVIELPRGPLGVTLTGARVEP